MSADRNVVEMKLQLSPEAIQKLLAAALPTTLNDAAVERIADALLAKLKVAQRSFSVKELAKRHGKSTDFIYAQIKSGALRGKRLGADVVITTEAEAAWLSAAPDV